MNALLRKFYDLSLRAKLIVTFLVVILIGGIISLSVGIRLLGNTIISLAQVKVKHDLSSAWMVYNERLNVIREIVDFTAAREGIQEALSVNQRELLHLYLSRTREKYNLDILTLTDNKGKVVIRTRNPGMIGDDQSQDELVNMALHNDTIAGTQIVSPEELLKEDRVLVKKANIKFVPTPMAAYRPEEREVNGMMLKAAAPVRNQGRLLGVLYGGVLLNRNYEIVDKVKEIVYKGEKYKGREIGTVTIFQKDVRISTNVKNSQGKRAIGTRLSEVVNKAVLQEGMAFIDRAFVVNDWYITAYEPIKNVNGQIIGILYVGMLERPYIDLRNKVMLTFAGLACICIILLIAMMHFSTSKIVRPLQDMVVATKRISKGDLSHRVEIKSRDEIGVLAESFNHMVDDLEKANEKLTEWGKTLERKVEERTQELRAMQEHLIQSEKLASLGKLAASIAHEINNPLGGILIYSHLLLEDLGEGNAQSENIKKIIRETTRCKDIVRGLLEFARPREPEMALIEINEVIEKTLSMMEKQALFQNINIKKSLSSVLPKMVADASQLQQVFMNLILNAAEAMDGKGKLFIRTSVDKTNKNIQVELTDTGHGISRENLGRLFEPFFTTKPVGEGTGLGLAISYGIIRRHDGNIEVRSEEGKGATFLIKLPLQRDIK